MSSRFLSVCGALFSVALMVSSLPLSADTGAASRPSEAQKALGLLKKGNFKKAAKICRKGDAMDDRGRRLCLLVSAVACNGTEDFKGAEAAARALIEEPVGPKSKNAAYRELGTALLGQVKTRNSRKTIDPSNKTLILLDEAESIWRRLEEDTEGSDPSLMLNLANTLYARMVFEKKWENEPRIRELLFEFLKLQPDGPGSDWARDVTCTSKRYDAMRWDPLESPDQSFQKMVDMLASSREKDAAMQVIGKSSPPKRKKATPPEYNTLAKAAGLEGQVMLQAIIDETGNIAGIRPVQRLPLCLTEDAILTVQQWTFEPGYREGKPAPMPYNLAVNFSLSVRAKNR